MYSLTSGKFSCNQSLDTTWTFDWPNPWRMGMRRPQSGCRMTGKKFLNPGSKIALCAVGMLIMGYFLVSSALSESFGDRTDIVRVIVFLGFTYLLIRSVRDLVVRPQGSRSARSRETE